MEPGLFSLKGRLDYASGVYFSAVDLNILGPEVTIRQTEIVHR
ncbi:MAG: hypothetical protein AAFV72_25265 [Cyanobacteria bacterium J06635_1]